MNNMIKNKAQQLYYCTHPKFHNEIISRLEQDIKNDTEELKKRYKKRINWFYIDDIIKINKKRKNYNIKLLNEFKKILT